MLVVIVEKLNFWVGLSSGFEGFANVVINFGPRTFLYDMVRVSVIINGFIDYIPCQSIITNMLHCLVDVAIHELFQLGSISLINDELRVMKVTTWWCTPDQVVGPE